jgi:uncharacterized protein
LPWGWRRVKQAAKRRPMKRTIGTALAALALLSCNTTQSEAKTLKPALWKVTDSDTTIYLFGTIHLLPQDLKWQSPKIDKAIRASQDLVLETVMSKDPMKDGQAMMQLGLTPGLPPLLDRVAPEKREALERIIKKSGVPIEALDRFETWAAALSLAAAGLLELQVSPKYGAEAILSERFGKDGKPVSGLETPMQQLGFFDSLPETAQRRFLTSIAEDESNAQVEFDAMIAAWGSGNVAKIALTFDDELKLSPELTDVLLKKRNANWSAWIVGRMTKPGTVFVAVGAGHLAGADSVNAMLAKRGLKVSRLQ